MARCWAEEGEPAEETEKRQPRKNVEKQKSLELDSQGNSVFPKG